MIRFQFRRFVVSLWSASRTARRPPRRPSPAIIQSLESRVLLSADLVKDVNRLGKSSNPGPVIEVNGTLYFSAYDDNNGVELWKSDGTAAGTVLVRDIRTGLNGSTPQLSTNVNGTLYFRANDGSNGNELWKSDGTSAGTVLVRNIRSGLSSSDPQNLTNVNGKIGRASCRERVFNWV